VDSTGDNIYVGIDIEGEYLTAVYIKLPIEYYISRYYYIITGYEVNGVRILIDLIVPHYTYAEDAVFDKYGVDKEKYRVMKLMVSGAEYSDISSMLIVIIDTNGKEYSEYIPSLEFARDI
jgi:hypothetical protein